VPLPSTVDTANHRVTARTNHFSLFQVVAMAPSSSVNTIKAFPNPFRPSRRGHMTFAGSVANTRIRVYTFSGELLKTLTTDVTGMVMWDGRNESGEEVASGVYYVLVDANGEQKSFRIAVQR
jgi:hypothetical protein